MSQAVRKQFSRALYDAYDSPAREALVSYLQSKGHTIVSNEENFNVDLVSQKNGVTYFNECEVKTAWKADWPTHWAEVRIPERKQRLLDKHEGTDGVLNFYIFRQDLKQAWRIKDTLLTPESLKEAKGRFIQKGEQFFHIPYTQAELVVL
ncbi:hypothetical protein HWB26_gp27 [Lentibacter phage vB_LenP_ICBM2]|jgi:hypothetical protein|uniref:Uncharacterized protein n=1 Tax=Lentibacter phage vB_LenP_ICBM2 TaxID=2847823 RepID=A0A3G2YRD1_9CAUD|nr:hypothetical protein HWB26_gp27 [Lentibacter phage vB_LenP_ICBM2]AYP28088.1 hypothetical protein vBLenPICBM2__27 [Lentibacter phage vB_LenP_ICBM2]